jgi:hypothetical protein
MKVRLTKKISDDWSKIDIYPKCYQRIGTYYKRDGRLYDGFKSLTDREEWEKILGKDLTPVDTNEFWINFNIAVDSKNNVIFDTDNSWDRFRVNFLEGHKEVAMGYNDRKPGTKYVLVKEQDAAEEVNKRAQIKIRAFREYDKLSTEQMRKVLRMYGHNAWNTTNEVVQSTLYQLIEDDPKKFIGLWVENDNKEIQFLIEEAIANNVMRNNKTIYKYGTDVVGYTLEEAIDYLKNPRNANVRIAIQSQIEGKKEVEAPVKDKEVKSQINQLLEEIEKEDEKPIETKDEAPVVEETSKEDIKPSKKKSSTTKKAK